MSSKTMLKTMLTMKWFALAASLLCAFSTVAAQCPSGHLGGGTHRRTIASGGRQRDYTLVVPSSYNNSEPLRLVITIHGYTQVAVAPRARLLTPFPLAL